MQQQHLLRLVIAFLVYLCVNIPVQSCDGFLASSDAPQVSSDGVWTDVIIDGEWRIQRHAIVGYMRLLDPHEHRLVFGDMLQCYDELQRQRECGAVLPMSSHVVICLHGWRGNRASMEEMSRFLTEQGGLQVINFGYASTHGTVQEHAYALESVVRNLRGAKKVSFVGHSLGNIVVRHLIYKLHVQGNLPPVSFERMVMIAPPNHGAELAETVVRRQWLRLVFGKVIDQLAPQVAWSQLEKQLATPKFEFGIIAGGQGDDQGFLPRIQGDDDGLLSIKTQRLEGSAAFEQYIGGLHQFMPQYEEVKRATLLFLRSGQF